MTPGYELTDRVEIDEESEEHVFAERSPTEAICVHISDELGINQQKTDTNKSAIYILPKADTTAKQEARTKVPLLAHKAAMAAAVGWQGIKAFTYAVGSFVDTVPHGHLRSKGRFH